MSGKNSVGIILEDLAKIKEAGCTSSPDDKKDCGVRWQEFDRNDRVVNKQKDFKSKKAMDKFIEKLTEKDNFSKILATY